jgi:hypothetical protein
MAGNGVVEPLIETSKGLLKRNQSWQITQAACGVTSKVG